MATIVQISDMHVACPGDPFEDVLQQAERLQAAVDWIMAMTPLPDGVLATGDLVDHFRPDQYQRLAGILGTLPMPVWLMMGNHDHRENLRAAFPDHTWLGDSGPVQYVVDDLPFRLIALDSQKTGETEGELCETRLDWLSARLSEAPDRPTVVALHHPPFESGVVQMDTHRLNRGRDAFTEIMRQHDQVVRVVCGHIHRPITGLVGGRLTMSCPSTSHQIALEIGREDGIGIAAEQPGCLLHHWSQTSGLISHVAQIGHFDRLADVDLRAGH